MLGQEEVATCQRCGAGLEVAQMRFAQCALHGHASNLAMLGSMWQLLDLFVCHGKKER